MNKRALKKAMKKSIAVLMSVAVFAGTVNMRAYATEVEITTEVKATEEENVAVEERVTEVTIEEATESEGETETTGEVVEDSKESVTGEIAVETITEEISSVEDTEEGTMDLTVEETTEVETTEVVIETDSTWDGVTTVSVYEAEYYTVTFNLNSEWGTGYNASVKVENTGDTVIHDWHLEYASMHTITNI